MGPFPLAVGANHRNGSELTGWTLYSTYRGTVHFNTDYDPVSESAQAVQIEVPGDWISQSFSTIPGQNYTLSFDLSAYTGYGGPGLGYHPCPCASVLEVTVAATSATLGGSSGGYVGHTLTFAADSSVTTVTLKNPSVPEAWGNYPQVDNVVVKPALSATLDHFQCYAAKGEAPKQYVDLADQFGMSTVFVGKPEFFCNPVDKNGEGISHPAAQLTCYKVDGKGKKREVRVGNEFGEDTLDVKKPQLLCVPSERLDVDAR
jgi:hypothetical protein